MCVCVCVCVHLCVCSNTLPLCPCQTKVHGRDRVKFMESLIVGDVAELKDNQVRRDIFDSYIHLNSQVTFYSEGIQRFLVDLISYRH